MNAPITYAPGWQGCAPGWTSSAKAGLGTVLNRGGRVWFRFAGIHVADLPTAPLPTDSRIQFAFFWPQSHRWESRHFSVQVSAPPDR